MTDTPDVRDLARPADVPPPRVRWMTRAVLPALILLGAGGVLLYAARDVLRPEVPVRVAPVVPRERTGQGGAPRAGAVVQAPGWVEPSPYAVVVPALVEGVVREVLVLEGDRVEAGQVVARLLDEEARLRVRLAEAKVRQRAAEVERARAGVESALAQVGVEEAALAEARDEFARRRELLESGSASPGEVRRLGLRVGTLEARVRSARQSVAEAQAGVAQAEALLHEAVVECEEAELRAARTEVRSPVAGVVLASLVGPGSRVGAQATTDAGTGVVRVYDPARLQVRVDVPLADAGKVGIGTRAVVTTEALPNLDIPGVVARVVHEANIQRNTVQFKVELENPPALLRPEMLVRVRLHTGTADATPADGGTDLLIPLASLTRTSEGTGWVWVVDVAGGSPVARRREVEFVPADLPGYVVAIRGVRLTDRVVVGAPAGLEEGVRVRATEAEPPG
jgi:HlyD family secretion protein